MVICQNWTSGDAILWGWLNMDVSKSKCVWDLFVFKGLSRFKSRIVNCIFFIVSVIFLRPSPALASSASQSSVPKLKTKTRDSRDPSVRFCMWSRDFIIFYIDWIDCYIFQFFDCYMLLHVATCCHEVYRISPARPGALPRWHWQVTCVSEPHWWMCSPRAPKNAGHNLFLRYEKNPEDSAKKVFSFDFFGLEKRFTSRISQTCHTCHASRVPYPSFCQRQLLFCVSGH